MKDWDVTLLVLIVAAIVIALIIGAERDCTHLGGAMVPDGEGGWVCFQGEVTR